MVARGKFFLYDSIKPALPAGEYRLKSELELDGNTDSSLQVAPLETHFNVTAPRMKLPPDQALMTFPPANSEGAYENRLPQIVLKKKTLPWDRVAASGKVEFHGQKVTEKTPWLALIVIAEGEGQIVHDQPYADCVTPGTVLDGLVDTPKASYLSVPKSTVDAIFPTVDDLCLLTHVREVNPDDTENAMGDDDGFLSVVIANRMPQYDTANCQPKAYTACLINLEGQLGVLPPPAPPRKFFELDDLFLNEQVAAVAASVRSGTAVPLTVGPERRVLDIGDATAISDAIRRGEIVFHEGTLVDRVGANADGLNRLGSIDAIDFLDANFADLAGNASAAEKPVLRVESSFAGFDFPLHTILPEQFFRFPVLTSWRFTCAGAGGFQELMSNLDVGLLGTVAKGGYERPKAECVPDASGKSSGDAPVTQIPLEVAETGHVGLPHLTRIGETTNSWYRGPFSPHQLLRNPLADEAQFPVLAHVSDHLRMMTPDGREDVSLAVAFETGRLLAMSQPSFVAAVQRWRAENFGESRARAFQKGAILDKRDLLNQVVSPRDLDLVEDAIREGLLPRLMEGGIIGAIERDHVAAVSMPRELVDPAVAVDALKGNYNRILAVGLGLDRAVVDMIAKEPASLTSLTALKNAQPGLVGDGAVDLDSKIDAILNETLETGLGQLAQMTVGKGKVTEETVRNTKPFETLDDFIIDRLGGK
jgi:hypothetical protein